MTEYVLIEIGDDLFVMTIFRLIVKLRYKKQTPTTPQIEAQPQGSA